MRKTVVRIVILACAAVLLLTGCSQPDKAFSPGQTGSEVWQTMPVVTYGDLEYDKLRVLEWNSGRLEATGSNWWAETELGYYYCTYGILYYADKTNLSTWVPVCSKPNCGHSTSGASSTSMSSLCHAYLGGAYTFVVRNERIYMDASVTSFPGLYSGKNYFNTGIFSKSLDCEDTRLEYVNEDAACSAGGRLTSRLKSNYWLQCVAKLNTDGSTSAKIYCLTDSGLQVLFQQDAVEDDSTLLYQTAIRGATCYLSTLLGETPSSVLYFENGEFVEWDVSGYLDEACYLSGNILRIFRQNDGYYDVNLETREETFVSEAQLQNSRVDILLPNCIVETTVGSAEHPEGAAHAMKLYDGTAWRDVEITAELTETFADTALKADGVASDCIFLTQLNRGKTNIYCISLKQDNLVLEYCGTVGTAF